MKNSSSTSKSTVNSSQKRDTFTNSSAKVQKTSKTTQSIKTSSSKSSNSAKTTVKSTSTVNNSSKTAALSKSSAQSKSNRDTFTYSSQTTATKSKTTSTASKTSSNTASKTTKTKTNAKNQTTSGSSNRDTFSCSAKMESLTRITKTSAVTTQKSNSVKNNKTSVGSDVVKSTVNTAKQGAAVGVNATKSDTQAKSTPTKNNDTVTNKSATASSKSKILESIQKQYEHTIDSKQKEAMKKTIGNIVCGSSTKKETDKIKQKEIDLSINKGDRIKCQNDTWNGGGGWSGCYSESMDAMWRVNSPNKLSANETHILQNDDDSGSIEWGCEKYKYVGSIVVNGKEYTGIVYPGIDSNGNKYEALRLRDLSKSDAEKIMNNELENGRAFCYRVYNTEALDQKKDTLFYVQADLLTEHIHTAIVQPLKKITR